MMQFTKIHLLAGNAACRHSQKSVPHSLGCQESVNSFKPRSGQVPFPVIHRVLL